MVDTRPAEAPRSTPSPELLPVSTSTTSSGQSSPRSPKVKLTLDLSSIPPLIKPSPPTNTLLITNLNKPAIFQPKHLQNLRDLINKSAPIHTWSPLKSFRRIVTSFETEEDATRVRAIFDGETIMGERIRIYFGNHTPTNPVDQHLQAPESKKLFFISPPPSPPCDWEIRNEEPPNAEVLAADLKDALHKLAWTRESEPVTPTEDNDEAAMNRKRSGSTVLMEADQDMPGIVVDDFSDNDSSPISGGVSPSVVLAEKARIMHTPRPPIETMHDA